MPRRMAPNGQKIGMEDTPTTRQVGVASPYLMTTAGTCTGTKPKLMLKRSGIGDNDQFLAVLDNFISDSSSDLNTPEIKIDEDLFSGRNTYSRNDCIWEAESEIACAINPERIARSNNIHSNQVVFDLSPASPDCCMDYQKLTAPGMADGCGATDDSCLALTRAPEQDHLRPQPQPSPSDFLTDIRPNPQAEVSIMDHQCTSSPTPQMPWNDGCDFKIPTEILDQINELFPDALPDVNVSSTELDMCLGMREDLLSGALHQCGLLKDEIFSGTEDRSQPEIAMEVGHSIFHDGSSHIQAQSTSHGDITHILAQSTSHGDITHIQAQSTLHGDITHIQAPSTSYDITRVQTQSTSHDDANHPKHLIPPMHTGNGQSVFPASEQIFSHDGLKSLVTCPSPVIPPQVAPSLGSLVPESTSAVSSVRITRQRRSARKPVRFRDTVALDDPVAATELNIPMEYPDEPTTSGYTTTCRKGKLLQRELTDREKYHRIRVLNNEASKRCREKRKNITKEMEEEVFQLEQRNRELKEKAAALTRLRDKFRPLLMNYLGSG